MRLSMNNELIMTLNAELEVVREEHKVKVKRGEYPLKRDVSAGLSHVRGFEYIVITTSNSDASGVQLARVLMKERDFWRNLRDSERDRYYEGNALYKDKIESEAFYDGVQQALSIVLEYTVLNVDEAAVMSL